LQRYCIYLSKLLEMKQHASNSSSKLHSIGIFLSAACAVHCLALPVLLLIASLFEMPFFEHPCIDLLLLPIAIILATYLIYKDYPLHKKYYPALLLLLGAILIVSSFLNHLHFLMGIGTFFIAIAQLSNWRLHKKCCH